LTPLIIRASNENKGSYADVNNDGITDLRVLVQFRVRDTQINTSEEVTLIGSTTDGKTIHGTDHITAL
jgi:hypothetical protein